MIRAGISERGIAGLRHSLGNVHPATLVPLSQLRTQGIVPSHLGFNPDCCFVCDREYFLIEGLVIPEIPAWVKDAKNKLSKRVHIVLLAGESAQEGAVKIAGAVAEECSRYGFGLAIETPRGARLVFPPKFKNKQIAVPNSEVGHIPSWLYQRLRQGGNFSPYLADVIKRFVDTYEIAIEKPDFCYDKECQIVTSFAEAIADGDPRLFFPLDRLQTLKSFERGVSATGVRDHFFHTWNNLFLGFIILDGLCPNQQYSSDKLLSRFPRRARLKPWESLWALTCLFHDPGYLGQDFWHLLEFGHGLSPSNENNYDIPLEAASRIENAWQTRHLFARRRMAARLCNSVSIISPQSPRSKRLRQIDQVLRSAYFDGTTTGHSLVSGLSLINLCNTDRTHHNRYYDKTTAQLACEVAASGMLFHDQSCRETLVGAGVKPIPFETLPYAAMLMFVDALQDDRRDISTIRFCRSGVLQSITIEREGRIVRAQVSLPHLELKYWPARIAEYESVMWWINSGSNAKFLIDNVVPTGK